MSMSSNTWDTTDATLAGPTPTGYVPSSSSGTMSYCSTCSNYWESDSIPLSSSSPPYDSVNPTSTPLSNYLTTSSDPLSSLSGPSATPISSIHSTTSADSWYDSTGTIPVIPSQSSSPQSTPAQLAAQEASHHRRAAIVGVLVALLVLVAAVGACWLWRRRRARAAAGLGRNDNDDDAGSEKTVVGHRNYIQHVDVVSLVDSADTRSMASSRTAVRTASSSGHQPSERSSQPRDSIWADDSEADAMATDGSTISRTVSQTSVSRSSAYSHPIENPFDHPAYTMQSATSRSHGPTSATDSAAPWMSLLTGQIPRTWFSHGSTAEEARSPISENPFEQDSSLEETSYESSGSRGATSTNPTSVSSRPRLDTKVAGFESSNTPTSATSTTRFTYPSPTPSPAEYHESPFADSPFNDPVEFNQHGRTIVQHRDAGPIASEIHLPPAYREIYGTPRM